jgi:hypothetical protein
MNDLKNIKSMIFEVRGYQVMLDADLAEIYQVETKVLNQAVKRNIGRFPPEFMFQLTKDEYENLMSQIATSSLRSQFVTSKNVTSSLRSQIAISKNGKGGRRYLPFAFTEHGVIMLSSVLNNLIEHPRRAGRDKPRPLLIKTVGFIVRRNRSHLFRQRLLARRLLRVTSKNQDNRISLMVTGSPLFLKFSRGSKIRIGAFMSAE